MPASRIVPTASRRPGHCALSGETQGPFIDTGTNVPRYGRIYLSFKWLDPILLENGYIKETDVEDLKSKVDSVDEENEALVDKSERFDDLVELISQYLPTPEAEVVVEEVVKYRQPTDEEIERWVKEKGGNHPAVKAAKVPEKGSTEEWFSLYGNPRTQTVEEEPTEELAKEADVTPDDGPPKVVELFEQNVDLDKVLAENVGTIKEFCEDKPEDFLAALVRREFHLADKMSRDVRKGVLEPIGYWDDEVGALYPEDEEEGEEEE